MSNRFIGFWCSINVTLKHKIFSAKTCLLKLSDKETGAVPLCFSLSPYCWVWVYVSVLRLNSTDVLIMYSPLSLCLWCWLRASTYFWNTYSFMSNFLCFMLQLIFNFTILIRVITSSFCHSWENFVFDSRLRALYKKKLLCGQGKTRQLKFIVIVNIDFCGKFLSSPVIYTNTLNYILFGQAVCLVESFGSYLIEPCI